MRILSTVTLPSNLVQKHPEIIKNELHKSICKKLTDLNLFIGPQIKNTDNKAECSMIFFAIGFSEIQKLKELAEKYPEIEDILKEIVFEKSE